MSTAVPRERAASFAELGHSVVAVEPTDELRIPAMARHPSSSIEWLDDALPDLNSLLARAETFDLVMLSAVWMHLDASQRRHAMPRVASLIRTGGMMIMSLRHGPVPQGRRMFEVSADETIESNHCAFVTSPQTHYGAYAGPMRSDIDEVATMCGLDCTMNVILDTKEAGFVENDWIGRGLTIGDTVRVNVALPDPRCVMTTLAQDELPKDNDILRTLTRHNRIQVGTDGQFPCAGVYAVIEVPGTVQTGDRVTVA